VPEGLATDECLHRPRVTLSVITSSSAFELGSPPDSFRREKDSSRRSFRA